MSLFGRKKKPADETPAPRSPGGEALARTIAEPSAADPLIGPKMAAAAILDLTMKLTTTDRGVHVESLVTALGALAGKACQVATLDGLATGNPAYQGLSLMTVGGANGDEYYFGDAINRPLVESQYSVWGLIGGGLSAAGAVVPDVSEMFAHSAGSVGGDAFGIPRYAEGTGAGDTPRNYLVFWDRMMPALQEAAPDPQQWPIAYGIAIQRMFGLAAGQFDLTVLARVAMDSAIATSKLKLG